MEPVLFKPKPPSRVPSSSCFNLDSLPCRSTLILGQTLTPSVGLDPVFCSLCLFWTLLRELHPQVYFPKKIANEGNLCFSSVQFSRSVVPDSLQSHELQHARPWRRKWQPTSVFLPWESQGQGSLMGCRLWVAQSRTRLKRLSSSSSRPNVYPIRQIISLESLF